MKLFLLLALTAVQTTVNAHSLYYAIGESTAKDKSNTQKLGFVYHPSTEIEFLADYNLFLTLDVSAATWQNLYGPDLKTGAVIPSFNYPSTQQDNWWYVKFGIGVAYVDQTRWGNRRLGDNWMFEDKLEFGIKVYRNHHMALSFSHYSNANTNKHNDGLNIISLLYQYTW
ncbi:acyloxyacyl hydrolase [Thalassotalea euphylliae]|uniref:Acyloxyacyl hydrolase n=1 Tax=Thalassotalea euphylliae TaxID=1655234 RepID=A0A3E0TSF2_9GAMM|nr:acyloxyacyl hydrolase [Thalassotalea euphylliae]REL27414.1 acyloxyacyl hydrolase [Thalassotalea euphylliae]